MATKRKPAKKVSAIKKKGIKKTSVKPKAKNTKAPAVKKKKTATQKFDSKIKGLSKGTRTKEGAKKTTLKKPKKGGFLKTLKKAVSETAGIKGRATKIRDRKQSRKDARNPGSEKKYRIIGSGARERGYSDTKTMNPLGLSDSQKKRAAQRKAKQPKSKLYSRRND